MLAGLPNLLSSSNSDALCHHSACEERQGQVSGSGKISADTSLVIALHIQFHELWSLPALWTLPEILTWLKGASSCSFKQNPVPCHFKLWLIFSSPLTPDGHVGHQPCLLWPKCFWIQGHLDANYFSKVAERVYVTTGRNIGKPRYYSAIRLSFLNTLIKVRVFRSCMRD